MRRLAYGLGTQNARSGAAWGRHANDQVAAPIGGDVRALAFLG
jgi:hypothetical protein